MKSGSENFILSFNRCLNVCSVPGIVLGTGDTAVNKTDRVPVFTVYRLSVAQVHRSDCVLPQILGYEFELIKRIRKKDAMKGGG